MLICLGGNKSHGNASAHISNVMNGASSKCAQTHIYWMKDVKGKQKHTYILLG